LGYRRVLDGSYKFWAISRDSRKNQDIVRTAPLRGLGITFIITALMAIGFMSFGGMLTGERIENSAPVEKQHK